MIILNVIVRFQHVANINDGDFVAKVGLIVRPVRAKPFRIAFGIFADNQCPIPRRVIDCKPVCHASQIGHFLGVFQRIRVLVCACQNNGVEKFRQVTCAKLTADSLYRMAQRIIPHTMGKQMKAPVACVFRPMSTKETSENSQTSTHDLARRSGIAPVPTIRSWLFLPAAERTL